MANGKKIINSNPPKSDNLVLALKLLILLVILILPVSFMILDSSRFLLVYQSASRNTGIKTGAAVDKNVGDEFNLQISIPAAQTGDKNTVSPAKLNSLFSNLKH